MGATEEQMQLLSDAGVGHVAYLLVLYSLACLLFLCKFLQALKSTILLYPTTI